MLPSEVSKISLTI